MRLGNRLLASFVSANLLIRHRIEVHGQAEILKIAVII